MCGLAGFLQPGGFVKETAEQTLRRLAGSLRHRGPDDAGTWLDEHVGIALGHRRLAVLDLTPAGHQPMRSSSGRYVIAFNGEIYNHLEIREELDRSGSPPTWRGRSDTETLLSAIDHWGIEFSLRKSVGMFAFALWDRQERKLILARDRIGEKPLYYGWHGDVFLFGSELKALRKHPLFCAHIDRNVLSMYMCRGYIVSPYSIYQNTFKLMPGTYLELNARVRPGDLPKLQTYWSMREVAEYGLKNPFAGSDDEAVEELETRLQQAVSLQSIADVPLGAFLSGGIDSTTIVALMQKRSSRPVKTFTVGFREDSYNEATHAKSVAQHLGTEHTELYVTSREAMEVIPKIPTLYDEPFGDSSTIPTYLVAQLARQQVTVSLSGDGGDELFGGYTRYQRTNSVWQAASRVPYFVRSAVSDVLQAGSQRRRISPIAWKASRVARYLSAKTPEECYDVQLDQRFDEHDFVLDGTYQFPSVKGWCDSTSRHSNVYNMMMYTDAATYLPDDILAKVDRTSMAVSLESRVPMLDHRVLEFAWLLPLRMKVRNRDRKWVLKQVLAKYVPSSLIERPKMGFGVPVGQWVRGPLREWAESLLSETRLRQDGFLNPPVVLEQWSQHLNGVSKSDDSIWSILMFQAWLSATA